MKSVTSSDRLETEIQPVDSGPHSHIFQIWNLQTGGREQDLVLPTESRLYLAERSVKLTNDGTFLAALRHGDLSLINLDNFTTNKATKSTDTTIKDAVNGKVECDLSAHEFPIDGFSPSETKLAVAVGRRVT